MATVLNTLYPPLIDTFMPAFPNTEEAIVHFTISPYNSSYEIQYLHVTLVNQKTNKNAFASESNLDTPAGTALVNGVWIIPFAETLDGNTNSYLQLDRDANYYTLYIPPSLLKENENNKREFVVNSYYKVQLRFDKYIESNDNTSSITTWNSNYLAEKRAYFSEWSSVCLLKAIPTITLHLNNFTIEQDEYLKSSASSITNISTATIPVRVPQYMPGIIPFAGNLTFEGDNDSGIAKSTRTEYYKRDIKTTSSNEYIMSYRIKVLDDFNVVVKDSGVLYPAYAEKTNNFYWLCDLTNAKTNVTYSVELTFTTNNQYTFSKTFNFTIIEPSDITFNPTLKFDKIELPYNGMGYAWKRYDDEYFANIDTATLNKYNSEVRSDGIWYEVDDEKVLVTCEDGWVTLTVTHDSTLSGAGYLFIKRATSLDNFQNWELIDCFYHTGETNLNRTITDKTVSSLVSYKYSVQFLTTKGSWTRTIISPEIIYPDFHDILISRGDRQLAIRYNAQIPSMTPVVSRVKIDTLGGRYPKFAENAKIHYRQFQLSGLIIAESDYNRKFLNDLDYRQEMAIYDERMQGVYQVRNDTIKETGELTVEYEDDEGNTISQTYTNGTYSQDIAAADTDIKRQKRDAQINTRHDLYPKDNWWWERKFREEAIEWLNDGEPKLYRSMPEGNMIVMIDSVSLTPNAQLGRRVWNFSATLYEVGDGNSLQDLDSLGIYPIVNTYGGSFEGDYSSVNIDTSISEQRLGQTYTFYANPDSSGTTLIAAPLYENSRGHNFVINSLDQIDEVKALSLSEQLGDFYQGIYEDTKIDMSSIQLKNVKIQFESLPQWYDLTSITPEGTIPGKLFFIVEDENGNSVEVTTKWENGEWTIEQVTDLVSGQLWSLEGKSITEFLTDWENSDPIGQSTGNNLIKININKDTSIYVDNNNPEQTSDFIQSNLTKQAEKLNNYDLGYKLKLNLVSPYDPSVQLERTIFVNEKGYYQVPSNMMVKEITLYDGAVATIDYIVEYKTKYDNVTEANSYEAAENIVGQISGEWDWNTSVAPLVAAKYWAYDKDPANNAITQQMVDSWTAVGFEGTPYTILNIQSMSNTSSERFIVGRTGTLNLETDYPTTGLYVNGKRMVQAPISRQKYLDEWEYVIDASVYDAINDTPQEQAGEQYWYIVYNNSGIDLNDWVDSSVLGEGVPVIIYLSDNEWTEETAREVIDGWYQLNDTNSISNVQYLDPMPNTVYAIANTAGGYDYKIYYLDEGWFNIEFPNIANGDLSLANARVPVYGMINYKATIMKKFWDPTNA